MRSRVITPNGSLPSYIAIEGLDGSGKSTVARLLAHRLCAALVTNPPAALGAERAAADASSEPIRRAWYANANRVAAEEAMRRDGRPVVMDRSVASTLAFGAARRGRAARPGEWPSDTERPGLLVILDVTEAVRLQRLASRPTQETDEEARLRSDHEFRSLVLAGYAALGAVAVRADGAPEEIVDQILALVQRGEAS